MATEESIVEHFYSLGVELAGPELQKCVEMCRSSGLEAETFLELWMAFSLSRLGGAAPTLQLLELLERKQGGALTSGHTDVDTADTRETGPAHKVYRGETPLQQVSSDVMADYLNTTPKSESSIRVRVTSRVPEAIIPLSSICPVTHSPNVDQYGKYSARTNSGDVVCQFGDENKPQSSVWLNVSSELCKILQLPNHEGNIFSTKAMYGFELLQEKAGILDSNIKYLSQHILHKADIRETVSVKFKSQVPVNAVGRIDCDANGRLNTKSVLLQGTWEDSLGQSVPVDLDHVKHFSLFPGQVVAVKGTNARGDKFVAQEIFCDASYQKPSKLKTLGAVDGSLQVVAACGPYTPLDNLSYNPLTDLINYIGKNKPHAALLIGPFIDANHQNVKDNTIAETYKSFFEKLVDNLMVAVECSSPRTQIVMVSSSKDVFHCKIYPTPSFSIKKNYNNLKMMPDPCTINIEGVIIGITSTDILMHLSKEEISLPAQGPDKIGRLVGHLLGQQSFYPLWPPSATLSVDTMLWNEHAHMGTTPDILLVPSDFRYFVKEINGCVIVNPERLVKGVGGGTFARFQVDTHSSSRELLCQILRI